MGEMHKISALYTLRQLNICSLLFKMISSKTELWYLLKYESRLHRSLKHTKFNSRDEHLDR